MGDSTTPQMHSSHSHQQEHCAARTDEDIEEMPSLDALTFEHEQCTTKNCHCQLLHRDINPLSPFGFQASQHTAQKQPLVNEITSESTGSSAGLQFGRSPLPFVFGAVTQNGTVSHIRHSVPDTRTGISNGTAELFGAEHSGRVEFYSFSQLGGSDANSPAPSDGCNAFMASQFQNLDYRVGLQHPEALDLTKLQSVLEVSSNEQSVTDTLSCPGHLMQLNSPGLIQPCSCAQQAAKFDDWTADELAGYFDTLCHIPKKMSTMAEMMYM